MSLCVLGGIVCVTHFKDCKHQVPQNIFIDLHETLGRPKTGLCTRKFSKSSDISRPSFTVNDLLLVSCSFFFFFLDEMMRFLLNTWTTANRRLHFVKTTLISFDYIKMTSSGSHYRVNLHRCVQLPLSQLLRLEVSVKHTHT